MRNSLTPTNVLEGFEKDSSRSPYVITSAYRTLRVLQAFAVAPHQFGLSELVGRMGLEKNQLYRSLKTLEQAGFLSVESDGRFALTSLLHDLSTASAHGQQQTLIDVAPLYLDELAAKTNESVNLFVRADSFAVCVDRRDSPHLVKLTSVLGLSVPLHAGAVPKAILAFLPEAHQEQLLTELPNLPSYTEKTVLKPSVLRQELAAIRERGYSISDEDYDASARGVGAPIFDNRGNVIAGISVGGPSFRVDDAALHTFAQLITRVSAAISHRLGYPG